MSEPGTDREISGGAPPPEQAAARDAAAAGTPQAGKRYASDAIVVTFDGARCIHAAACLRGLPAVFDTKRRPWILPSAATADEIADVVERCPSGALHYERRDGGAPEPPDPRNTLRVRANGPYYARGKLRIVTARGELYLQDVRIALCRCGQSQHKPFCDNAHIAAGFTDAGAVPSSAGGAAPEPSPAAANVETAMPEHGELTIKMRANGPLKIDGDFELIGAFGQGVHRASETALCRCGGSANKPFCDGSHRHNGFQG